MKDFTENLNDLFGQSREIEREIKARLAGLKYA